MILFLILLFFYNISGFNLCVVGASSGLGREIIYQALQNNNKILGLTNNPNNIKIPNREGGLSKKETNIPIFSKNLKIDNYYNYSNYNFKNIVFTTSAQPFEKDYSDIITENILSKNINTLEKIVLISADGVGESLKKSNIGIQIMNNWYLQDAYRAKNQQEKIIEEYCIKYNKKFLIIRPKALSYGFNLFNIKSRQNYAYDILNYFNSKS
tara:strand:+ start:385 stop:1017 length:633 start_codon:yes stop_codon:yes gene_type:complete